ncbi:MAG: anthranilate phosphoribosyltransferase [Candidatus Eisenbacteria bacterium]|uniref:Anthranilate phosphoribosyltransferase n=1 Tax=Eiseniibacteriota bacterium TaxID=2212470 RepID=A0A7Y2H116_UNCEI|nr:anthranilate phosphoribosyltransferase [Candidatus Eisenbacteria bacterium]
MSAELSVFLKRLSEAETLSRAEAREAMDTIMRGEATPAQIGAFLMGLRQRGETPEEVAGAAESMRSHATRLPVQCHPLIDTCGTGGDGAGTFNISTAAAFVVGGAGVHVAKHGNRSISSACGSADVLEALGARINLSPEATAECLETTHVGFMFAPFYHPAAKHAAGPRRELAIRTLFNLLGPLCNPAPVTHQVMGIFSERLLETAGQVLGLLGHQGAMVVHGDGGLDEIALSGPTHYVEWKQGQLRRGRVTPEELGIAAAPIETLQGGDAETNAEIVRQILKGTPGPPADVVVLNAGACLYITDRASSLKEGVAQAREVISSGRAQTCLEDFVGFTQRVSP